MKEKPCNKSSRRNFLEKGIKLGLATAVGSAGIASVVGKTSDDGSPSGETIELMTTDGTLVKVDSTNVQKVEHPKDHDSEYRVREGFKNRKFVMVVDLARCKNAQKCVSSCNKSHFITGENAWLKIYKMQDNDASSPYWQPTTCMHCDKPPCVKVCPVDATFKRRDGIVLIDNERCIGCRFCMAACPYSARVFNWSEPNQEITMNMDDHHDHGMHYSADHAGLPSVKGTVDKCDFCPHMIEAGEMPHCVSACPNGVFFFGDQYEDTVTNGDETFRLSALLKEKAGYRLMENLGTEPSLYYLPPVDRIVEFEEGMELYNEKNPDIKSH